MVEFDGSPLEPPLVQGVSSIEYVETKQERLLIGSNELKVFNELSVITNIKSDGIEASTTILLDNDSTKGLLEQPKDNYNFRCVWGFEGSDGTITNSRCSLGFIHGG
ncbi:hypothetical protein GQ457_07G009020 [Hibiscus cannabinus]